MAVAPLMAAGGALRCDSLISTARLKALTREARGFRHQAENQVLERAGQDGWRGGNPDRYLAFAGGGQVQRLAYHSPEVVEGIGKRVGKPVRPSGAEGSYSYYDRPGHYLGLHRDIRTCDVTLITCLHKRHGAQRSGVLRLYPAAVRKSLYDIDEHLSFIDVDLEEGQSVLLLGGAVPHEVKPAVEGFARTISVLCFEMIGSVTSVGRHAPAIHSS